MGGSSYLNMTVEVFTLLKRRRFSEESWQCHISQDKSLNRDALSSESNLEKGRSMKEKKLLLTRGILKIFQPDGRNESLTQIAGLLYLDCPCLYIYHHLMPTATPLADPFLSPCLSLLEEPTTQFCRKLFELTQCSLLSRPHMAAWIEGSEWIEVKTPHLGTWNLSPHRPSGSITESDKSCKASLLLK